MLTIDAALIEAAVASGKRRGVLGTIAAGVRQQVELLQRAGAGELELETVIRPDAYAALKAGDDDRHDEILLAELAQLARRVDAVILAQASIARILKKAQPGLPAPVLSSPALAVARVKALLDARTPAPAQTGTGSAQVWG
ncbi:MAG: hypothetical protein HY329_10535 [Chloroflexi bacterium]|nr:hypothetical protein [Chloroflexota bacterium]